MPPDSKDTVDRLLDLAGRTYAADAGIRLTNTPAPLYRLLVLSVLLSTRIRTATAVAATRELIRSGLGTPHRMRDATWRERVDALGRAHYVRYDESTATVLGEGARLVLDEYSGDLRRMRERADGDRSALRAMLREVPRLGPVGADIFCREVQQVWPEFRPYLDRKATDGAGRIGLPEDSGRLAGLVSDDELARLSAALVRVALDRGLAERVAAG